MRAILVTLMVGTLLATPASAQLSLHVTSDHDSRVYLDGIFVGKTPLSFGVVAPGEHVLTIRSMRTGKCADFPLVSPDAMRTEQTIHAVFDPASPEASGRSRLPPTEVPAVPRREQPYLSQLYQQGRVVQAPLPSGRYADIWAGRPTSAIEYVPAQPASGPVYVVLQPPGYAPAYDPYYDPVYTHGYPSYRYSSLGFGTSWHGGRRPRYGCATGGHGRYGGTSSDGGTQGPTPTPEVAAPRWTTATPGAGATSPVPAPRWTLPTPGADAVPQAPAPRWTLTTPGAAAAPSAPTPRWATAAPVPAATKETSAALAPRTTRGTWASEPQ